MKVLAEPIFVRRSRGPISSSPLLVDANQDGWPEVFVGGPVLQGLTWDGSRLPRWPQRGRRPFASSPAFGDVHGDGRGKVIAGCDDGRVYAFHADGDRVPGWPVQTGADVFSSPALADLNGDKALEVVVGSDDGGIYVLRGDGGLEGLTLLPGRPFVSASPTVADFDHDGVPEIAVGAWDGRVYRWRPGGREPPAPLATADHVIWSSGTAFEVEGQGRHLAFAADRVYMVSHNGTLAPGWPQRTQSWTVSSPAIVELRPHEGATVLVGSEKLYAWDLLGRPRPGWPVSAGDFLWSSPIVFDLDGDGEREILIGSWDGGIYAFRPDSSIVPGFPLRSGGAVFATPGVAPLPSGGGILVAPSWDGTVRGWRLPCATFQKGDWLQFRGNPARTGLSPILEGRATGEPAVESQPQGMPRFEAGRVGSWPVGRDIQRITVDGSGLAAARRLMVVYEIAGEHRPHPVPTVNSNGQFVALIQPLRSPHRMRFHVECVTYDGKRLRWPSAKEAKFMSRPSWWPARFRLGGRPGPAQSTSGSGEPSAEEDRSRSSEPLSESPGS